MANPNSDQLNFRRIPDKKCRKRKKSFTVINIMKYDTFYKLYINSFFLIMLFDSKRIQRLK